MNEDWLHKIHDRMAEYETDEPDNLWSAIDKRHTQAVAERQRLRRRIILMRTRRIVAAVIVLAVAIPAVIYMHDRTSVVPVKSTESVVAHNKDMAQTGVQLLASDLRTETATRKMIGQSATAYGAIATRSLCSRIAPDSLIYNHDEPHDTASSDISMSDINEEAPLETNGRNLYEPKSDGLRDAVSIRAQHTSATNNFSLSLYSSGVSGSVSNSRFAGDRYAAALGPGNATWLDSPLLGILVFSKGEDIEADVKHHTPVRAGISFSYALNDRLSVESGLSYTMLASDIRKGSQSHYFTGRQKLHYVGIPLNLRYRLFSWRRFDVYASAGALAEKCVWAKLDSEYILDHNSSESSSEDLEKPFQWSVNASAGAQFNLSGSVGLFVEPGVSYYFDDGTDLRTVYKDKPVNFNLNLGLRISFGR